MMNGKEFSSGGLEHGNPGGPPVIHCIIKYLKLIVILVYND